MSFSGISKLKDNTPIKVGILIFNGAEVLDFCGPFEVFSVTGLLFNGLVKVTTFAESKTLNANGLSVNADELIDPNNLPQLDVLVVPGGLGTIVECKNPRLLEWVTKLAPSLRFVISVCTGVQILGQAGILDGQTYTTHHKCYEMVEPTCPKGKLCRCRRYVDNGKVLTSAGISAGIDVSFHFIRKLYGSDAAVEVAEFMEYDWKDEAYKEKCNC